MKKSLIFVIVVLIVLAAIPTAASSGAAADASNPPNEAQYMIVLKSMPTVGDFVIDSRYIPVEFNQDIPADIPAVPEDIPQNIVDSAADYDPAITLEEIQNAMPPEYKLYHFVDKHGEIQLRAYGEKHEYIVRSDGDIDEVFVALKPEPTSAGMYPVTPDRINLGDSAMLLFSYTYAGPTNEMQPIDTEDEPFA